MRDRYDFSFSNKGNNFFFLHACRKRLIRKLIGFLQKNCYHLLKADQMPGALKYLIRLSGSFKLVTNGEI